MVIIILPATQPTRRIEEENIAVNVPISKKQHPVLPLIDSLRSLTPSLWRSRSFAPLSSPPLHTFVQQNARYVGAAVQ